ncbi:anthranilate synthase component I [Basfia succiniciproducens]|uniref:Anthranilate synthase component 1 n=1 Tax=Basfia succiniciproducens TaxID=653940 RepID=A0A1G5AD38_9PAST|nr:anthranilate synthase component I [Basfia succiniciproducens]QIM68514.1 anthranilate synthase component I [Basfia succiniciproducens]SCX75781.1 anthranilate synthase, component I [Basfia succiniciproducens]
MPNAYIQTLSNPVQYQQDLTAVFATVGKTNSLLLESAEISSKNSLQSLLIINAALKVSCLGQIVTFTALTANGSHVLPLIKEKLQGKTKSLSVQQNKLIAEFFPIDQNLDEDSKLQSLTVFDGLRVINQLYQHSKQPVFLGGLFAYDLVANFIPMNNITLQDDGLSCPDYVFYLAEQLLRLDHPSQQATLQTFCFNDSELQNLQQSAVEIDKDLRNLKPLPAIQQGSTDISTNHEDEKFKQIITALKHHIYIGDVFQIVPSRRFILQCPNTLATYRQLKENNPSPYMFFMQDEEFTLFGASPESALKYSADNRQLEIYPIAGSRPRGFDAKGKIDPELDARLELEMRLDHKEQAEHLMLVDLARNDVARVCESGTRHVKELMQVDRYSHIMHLVSRVVGKLRPELDALHAYQACMNMGTLTGAPKIKAMQLIYQFEKQKRHSYGGAVGYLSSDGNLDTCIVIRSAFVQNGIAYVQAGCGEVLDSDPQMEADETRHKAQAVIKAILQTNAQAN